MKNDKKKRQNIGVVAQDVKEVIPEEFEAVINEDDEYMSINYGRMCAILWKSHQEMMVKVEKMKEEIKELKGTPKPKDMAKQGQNPDKNYPYEGTFL